MQSYRVVALGDRMPDAVRKTRKSPGYGHPTPEDGGFPPAIFAHRLALNAYATGRRLVAQKYVSNGLVEPELKRLLQDRDVANIHVRDTDAGCYDFCIEKANEEKASSDAGIAAGGVSHE